jgi:6-phosphogluconolactonase (cycloisomerase 2 family)
LADGAKVALTLNGGNPLTVAGNGSFTFGSMISEGDNYLVAVASQPTGEVCSVAGFSGTAASNVTNIAVACSPQTYSIGGNVTGLPAGVSLTLDNDGADALSITANGTFTFATPVPYGGSYAVTVANSPTHEVCTVSNGSGSSVAASVANIGVACTPWLGLAYVGSGATSNPNVSLYGIEPNGTLTLVNSAVASGIVPAGMAFANLGSAGRFLYMTNPNTNGVAQYAIAADGTLNPLTPATAPTGSIPEGIVVDPSNRYVYVTNQGDGTVSELTINSSNGTLSPMTPAAVTSGQSNAAMQAIAVNPSGNALYATDITNNDVAQFTIGSNGVLSAMSTATVPAGSLPVGAVVDPSGKYLYVANSGNSSVSQYTINSTTGSLSPMSTPTVPGTAESYPGALTVDTSGRYVYMSNLIGNSISQYLIGPGGALAPMSSPTVEAGVAPGDVVTDPTGQFAYSANSGGTISLFSIGTAGALTALTPPTTPSAHAAVIQIVPL